jgi:hypothetical protein
VSPEHGVVIEVFGEGKTDVGQSEGAEPPIRGVVPILVHTLCGRPNAMLVKRYGMPFLQARKGTLPQKVRFAKRQARLNRSAGAVFVVDTEGERKARVRDLEKGRQMEGDGFPFAVGVAHPCIESWLLADAAAIRKGVGLAADPQVPSEPETLPAPRDDRQNNPKTVLARVAGSSKGDLTAEEKWKIAAAMDDMGLVRRRCPLGFAPFADEVEGRILPLF